MSRKNKVRLVINLFIFVVVMVSWLQMFRGSEGILSSGGFRSLKYFTVLSNLLEAVASFIWVIDCVRHKDMRAADRLKYIACVSVMLTFLTVVVFLGPLFGYGGMFAGANLWFHLLIPLLSLVEFTAFNETILSRKDNFKTLIPLLIYGVAYLGNILINEIGEWPYSNDWYGFATWGLPIGVLIFLFLFFVVYGVGLTMKKINELIRKYSK